MWVLVESGTGWIRFIGYCGNYEFFVGTALERKQEDTIVG